jgi:polyvinyl alcohol dehydrogenase (cytochrome)
MAPTQILQTLENGSMKAQAAERSRAQRRALAEYLSGKPLPAGPTVIPASAFCNASGESFRGSITGASWNGWGAGITNMRFQPADPAGLTVSDVPNLKLKWAFGLPGATSGGTQPVVANGRIYVGDAEGDLFALDAKSGCIFWHIEVEAGIRSAVTLGERDGGGLTAWFGDQAANMYAVDAATGKLLWKVRVDEHPQAAITAASALHARQISVLPISRERARARCHDGQAHLEDLYDRRQAHYRPQEQRRNIDCRAIWRASVEYAHHRCRAQHSICRNWQ